MSSLAFFLILQSILILQPTQTPDQKYYGTLIHALLTGAAAFCLVAGFVVIYTTKSNNFAEHFTSWHGTIGLTVLIYVLVQSLGGSTMFFVPPNILGFDGRVIYKYHRTSGYMFFVLFMTAITLGTQSRWVQTLWPLPFWFWIIADILIITGVFTRIRTSKLPFYSHK